MAVEYSIEVCRKLEETFRQAGLSRPMRISRYDAGAELTFDITDIEQANSAQVRLKVERFVGGGFAGQVYKVRILSINAENTPVESLKPGGFYAMKILIPPSGFSLFFRNMLYWLGFQGPFQLQVNPAATRAGALWQKFIRQAAKIRFGDEKTVADIYATFVDRGLGSCGELSEWINGRTWQLEVDDRMDLLKRWRKGGTVNAQQLGSAEYREKLLFMREFVRLLHEMGAYEFARQYEWTTCKSQPNCLKPIDGESEPTTALTAVDFRAGLALLPFLPMSPGDFKLIIKGIMRGSLVQFDRGSLDKLKLFINKHSEGFGYMPRLDRMLGELKANEDIYRNSVLDITHNHIRLFYSRPLWATILGSAVTGWKTRNLIDQRWESKLRGNGLLTILFFVMGLVPFLGKFIRRLWARPDWREHYAKILTSSVYFKLAVRAKIAEKVILWHRAGRIDAACSLAISESFGKLLVHLPFSLLPAGLHKFLTDFRYAKERLAYFIVRPVKLYFN
ncbi:MAG: hypothetical protein ACYSRZ_01210, partial [Planctomycetota bacterium]